MRLRIVCHKGTTEGERQVGQEILVSLKEYEREIMAKTESLVSALASLSYTNGDYSKLKSVLDYVRQFCQS